MSFYCRMVGISHNGAPPGNSELLFAVVVVFVSDISFLTNDIKPCNSTSLFSTRFGRIFAALFPILSRFALVSYPANLKIEVKASLKMVQVTRISRSDFDLRKQPSRLSDPRSTSSKGNSEGYYPDLFATCDRLYKDILKPEGAPLPPQPSMPRTSSTSWSIAGKIPAARHTVGAD